MDGKGQSDFKLSFKDVGRHLRRRLRDIISFVLLNIGEAISQIHIPRLPDLCLMNKLPSGIENRADANHGIPIQ